MATEPSTKQTPPTAIVTNIVLEGLIEKIENGFFFN